MSFFSILRKKSLVLIFIVIIFYSLFALFSDINDLIIHFEKINYFLIPLILLSTITGLFVKSVRQYFLLKQVKIEISFKENLILYFAGLSLLSVPFGMGGIIKSHFLFKNFNQPISKTTPVIFIERFHDAIAMYSIIVIFVLISNFDMLNTPLTIIGFVIIFFLLILKNHNFTHKMISKLIKIKFLKLSEQNTTYFYDSTSLLSKNKILISSWLIGLLGWIFDAIAVYLSFIALGLNLDFFIASIIGFSSILFGSISFIPGGIGITELSFVQILSLYGIKFSLTTALIIFIRLTGIWFSTFIGFFALRFVQK